MIGKSLSERFTLCPLAPDKAVDIMKGLLASHGRPLVEVRARDPRMVAFAVARADEASVRFCRSLGFRLSPGGTGVFGLLGSDAAGLLRDFPEHHRTWLEIPCAVRETKVVLIAGGRALLSVDTSDGKAVISTLA